MPPTSFCSEAEEQNSLHQLLQRPVQELADVLATETQQFLAHLPSDTQAGLALFAKAIVEKKQDAWACLYSQYKPLVLAWIKRHPMAERIITYDGDATSLINGAFAKFFTAVTPGKFADFSSLVSLLKYLQLCTRSVVCDEVRRLRERDYEQTLDDTEEDRLMQDDPTERILSALAAPHLWQVVLADLHNDEERYLVIQTYWLGRSHQQQEACFPENQHLLFLPFCIWYLLQMQLL